jgi:hypothetical protein
MLGTVHWRDLGRVVVIIITVVFVCASARSTAVGLLPLLSQLFRFWFGPGTRSERLSWR